MLADLKDTVYPGCRELIEALHEAASLGSVDAITHAVQERLSRLATAGRIGLSSELREPCGESYARRLIYESHDPVYTVLAMVWGPKQWTPVHDHAGLWCVEGVVEGSIHVTQYDLVARDGDRCRFEAQETVSTGVGSSGRLIPPFDYHTIGNASADDCAVTIHVYGGEMARCKIYEPLGDGWYQELERELSYTS